MGDSSNPASSSAPPGLRLYTDFSPRCIRNAALLTALVLGALLLAGQMVHLHGPTQLAEAPGFYAWFGFGACVAIIVVSKALGPLLKRPAHYYDHPDADDPAP